MNDRRDDRDVLYWDDEQLKDNVRVNRLLIHYFPELKDDYEREIVLGGWEEEGPMVVYSFVFHPFLERALAYEPEGSPLLDRVFAFLRVLEADRSQPETATTGIADFIASRPRLLDRAKPHVGPRMREALEAS